MRQLDKPGIKIWSEDKLLDAAMSWPYYESAEMDDEWPKEWKKQVKQIADTTRRTAADMGHKIHAALEAWYRGLEVEEDYEPIVKAVQEYLIQELGTNAKWEAERTFSFNGYGGTVDLSYTTKVKVENADNVDVKLLPSGIILDFKTKNTADLSKVKGYDEHCMQLAAYREALCPTACCYNLFVGYDNNNGKLVCTDLKLVSWTEEELIRGYKMFDLLKQLWYTTNKIPLGD